MAERREDNEDFDISKFLGDTDLSGLDRLPSGPQGTRGVIRDENFGGWLESHDVIQPADGYEKLSLSHGLVKFEVRSRASITDFKWQAQLPEFLQKIKPQDLAKAEDRIMKGLLPFMFLEMPKMLGVGKLTDGDTATEFARISKVDIKYRGDKVDTEYRMANIDDRVRFALGFVTRSSQIQSMKLYGGPTSATADYTYEIDYADGFNPDRATLSLPVSKKGISSATQQLAGWMLSTHDRSADLGDLATPSTYLSVSMHDILARALDKRNRPR